MTNIDQEIREALLAEDEGALHELGEEQNMLEQVLGIFQGKNRWLNVLSWFMALVIFGISIYAMLQFLRAGELADMIFWGIFFSLGMVMVGMMKIWFWMEMNKNSVVREILRLELRIKELEKRLARG